MEELADALDLSVLELMRCQRQEQPLPKQELAEVYAQTLQTARHQSRRRMLKVGIAAVLTACLLLAAHYVPLDHLFRVWKMNYHTTGEAAALFTVGSREDRCTAHHGPGGGGLLQHWPDKDAGKKRLWKTESIDLLHRRL